MKNKDLLEMKPEVIDFRVAFRRKGGERMSENSILTGYQGYPLNTPKNEGGAE